MLKILHVNYFEKKGGAAVGVHRLHSALKNKGVESKILVAEKTSNDFDVIGPTSTLEIIKFLILISVGRFFKRSILKSKNPGTYSFNYLNTNILKKINRHDCDVVNLHWIGYEMISLDQINKINKPIVWTFWDKWPFSAVEHYDDLNENSSTTIQKKNKLINVKKFFLNKKKKLKKDIAIISPSKWLTSEINKSNLFQNSKKMEIPYNLDTDFWKGVDKLYSRELFNLPNNKKLLLFGSATATNKRKGFDFLIDFFEKYSFDKNIELIIFGLKPKNLDQMKISYKYLGHLNDDNSIRALYSASDLLLMPSIAEAFGQICSEAASCGLPSLIFEKTGMVDFVEHKYNGYISKNMNLESN